jgi:hypothetical protein
MHAVDDVKPIQPAVAELARFQEIRDDADDTAAAASTAPATTSSADAAAAIDQTDAVLGHRPTERRAASR